VLKTTRLSMLCFLLLSRMHAYVETYTFKDLYSLVDSTTMVICDIDNTVMIPHQYEGSDMWFVYTMNHRIQAGDSRQIALEKVLPEYTRLQKIITVKPVEPEIPQYIQQWQSQNITVMGLTSRGGPVIQETIDLLSSLAIDFSLTAPTLSPHTSFMLNDQPIVYKQGVIFCTTTDKGEALVAFFRATHVPQKIVYIDDTHSKVVSVEKALKQLCAEGHEINYTCFHYKNLDEYIATLPKN